jgi:hypothetical protein
MLVMIDRGPWIEEEYGITALMVEREGGAGYLSRIIFSGRGKSDSHDRFRPRPLLQLRADEKTGLTREKLGLGWRLPRRWEPEFGREENKFKGGIERQFIWMTVLPDDRWAWADAANGMVTKAHSNCLATLWAFLALAEPDQRLGFKCVQ